MLRSTETATARIYKAQFITLLGHLGFDRRLVEDLSKRYRTLDSLLRQDKEQLANSLVSECGFGDLAYAKMFAGVMRRKISRLIERPQRLTPPHIDTTLSRLTQKQVIPFSIAKEARAILRARATTSRLRYNMADMSDDSPAENSWIEELRRVEWFTNHPDEMGRMLAELMIPYHNKTTGLSNGKTANQSSGLLLKAAIRRTKMAAPTAPIKTDDRG